MKRKGMEAVKRMMAAGLTVCMVSGMTLQPVLAEDAASGSTIHMLVKATDDGKHTLSHYQRVVITVA